MADDAPGGGNEDESVFGSEAPSNHPQVVGVGEHSTHPLWQASRASGGGGRANNNNGGRANGRGESAAARGLSTAIVTEDSIAAGEGPRYAPISYKELELLSRMNADGAESSVWSDDDDDPQQPQQHKHHESRGGSARRRSKRPRDDGDGAGAGGEAGGESTLVSDSDRMARAAFGGELGDDGDEVEDSVAESESATGGNAQHYQQPIRGETCVGCTLDRSFIDQVDSFVRRQCGNMSDGALYKAAALFYKSEIAEKRRREGVYVPVWRWKDLRCHYSHHVTDPVMQRTAAVRSLGAMRAYAEQSLLKVMPDGTKMLDPKNAELLLKVVRVAPTHQYKLHKYKLAHEYTESPHPHKNSCPKNSPVPTFTDQHAGQEHQPNRNGAHATTASPGSRKCCRWQQRRSKRRKQQQCMKNYISRSSVVDRLLDGALVSEVVVQFTDLLGRRVQKPIDVRPVGNLPILASFVCKAAPVLKVAFLV